MIKINRQFVLTNTKDRLIELLRSTVSDWVMMLTGGMIILIFTGNEPVYNPGLGLFFLAVALVISFTGVVINTIFPDKTE